MKRDPPNIERELEWRFPPLKAKPLGRSFPAMLASARNMRGMSQTDLAERTGFRPSAISHFERGRRTPSLTNLCKLADALGVSTDYLLGRDFPAKIRLITDDDIKAMEKAVAVVKGMVPNA